MRVRDGEERERERRIQLRVYIQKKSNETHKRQKRLKSMGGDTREDHIQHTLYTPRDSRALSPRAPRKRGAQAADLSGSLGTVEGDPRRDVYACNCVCSRKLKLYSTLTGVSGRTSCPEKLLHKMATNPTCSASRCLGVDSGMKAAAIAGGQAGAAKLNVSVPDHIKRASAFMIAGLMLTAAFGGFMCSLVMQGHYFGLSIVSMVVMLLSGHRALFL